MTEIEKILDSKYIKPKEKTETISKMLLEGSLSIDELIDYAKKSKDPVKATCIEAMEFATKINPEIATQEFLQFVSATLAEKAPRIKWESAKVIGNIAHLYAGQMDEAVKNLLSNTEHTGTVVRWSAAFALGQIIITKHASTISLRDVAEKICNSDEKNSIKKIYLEALKKAGK
jgi:hypothetical protein